MRANLVALLIGIGTGVTSTGGARAAAVGPEATQTAILTIVVNDVDQGELPVVLAGDDVLVPQLLFEKAGLQLDGGRSMQIRGALHRSLSSLSPPLRWAFDEKELTLRITAPPALFGSAKIDLLKKAPPGLVYKKDTSAFFNYASRLTDGRYFDLFTETGVSIGGNLLFTGASLTPDHRVVRGLTNFTIDDPKSMRRIVIGDSFATSGALGGGLFLGGVQVARNFSLDPYFVRVPAMGFGGMVSTPSTVDVYVNDTLVRREVIGPGPFQFSNLTVPSGSGITRYVVRDAYGTEQQMSATYYLSPGTLGEGVSEYAYALGARRDSLATESFKYGPPGMLGRHRLGLNDWITAGLRFDAGTDLISVGPTVTTSLPFGAVDLGLSVSDEAGARGWAAMLGYTFTSRRFGLSSYVRTASERYATLSLHPDDDRGLLEGSASLAIPTGRMTWTAMETFARTRDHGRRAVSTIRTNLQLVPGLGLVVSASKTWNDEGPSTFGVFAALTLSLDGGVNASLSAQHEGGATTSTLDVNKPLPRGSGYGYRASATFGDSQRYSAIAMGQTSFGRYSASYLRLDGVDHSYLEAAGSIVAVAGGGVFFARPVQQGFAVISVPGAEGVRGYLDNQVVGRTNASGKLVVTDLLPFYANRIGIADADVPLSYGILSTELVVAPPYRGGVLIEFPVRRTRFFRGRLLVHLGGKAVVPQYGEVTVKAAGKGVESPIGKNGEFDLEDLDPGTYPATIEWADEECHFQIAIPASALSILDLGELTCIAP